MTIHPNTIYDKSNQVIAGEIENDFIIISISADKKKSVDQLYFLNETARELWENLNGKRSVYQLVQVIRRKYHKDFHEQIHKDIIGLLKELLIHKIIVKVR